LFQNYRHIKTITISLEEYNALKEQIENQKTEIELLKNTIILLRKEIELLKNNRNSNTSSTPPSQDYFRSNQKSLRKHTGKNSGGQYGHKGSNLKMAEFPDEIIEYKPQFCRE
jgi:hypothetical protein